MTKCTDGSLLPMVRSDNPMMQTDNLMAFQIIRSESNIVVARFYEPVA
jgi:hypothetical protein